jgi:hypothetical protein
MYSDEWEAVMTAESIDERIQEFVKLARERSDGDIESTVFQMTHESYLFKHTPSDALSELNQLQAEYPEEFDHGEANEHIMQYIHDQSELDFWYDYVYLSLAAGLEWAILQELKDTKPP